MTAGREIERKFLLDAAPPGLDDHPSTAIRQGYLAIAPDGTEVRVRERGGEAVLTVKQGAGRSRAEEEVRLEAEAFARLWPLTEGRRIEKVRHLVDDGAGHVIEVDVFDGALRGLVTAEVEFASDGDAEGFTAPAWLGRDVTDDPRFKNQRLALEGLPQEVEQ